MAMPKAAMDEDAPASPNVRNVWTPGKSLRADAVADPQPTESATHDELRLGVALLDTAHPRRRHGRRGTGERLALRSTHDSVM